MPMMQHAYQGAAGCAGAGAGGAGAGAAGGHGGPDQGMTLHKVFTNTVAPREFVVLNLHK